MTELDAIDRRILNVLQADGRISNLDLAQKVHLSPPACSERVKRLRDRGVIVGYTALVDPAEVGLPLLIVMEVSLDRNTSQPIEDFAKIVRRTPEILECLMIAGGFDYLIKVRVKDMAAYRSLLSETFMALPGIRETRSYAVLEEVKLTTALHL